MDRNDENRLQSSVRRVLWFVWSRDLPFAPQQIKPVLVVALVLLTVVPIVGMESELPYTLDPPGWPMAGANPQRTSWTSEEIRGGMSPLWATNIEPFIPFASQMIAAYDTIYVSTARGLYALNSETGALRWAFPTRLPLGHSPTVADGVVYVGGHDRHLYALNAYSGQQLWAYEAGSGFSTNPLVIEGKVILGNRDGYLYAVNIDGSLAWRFKTNGPILFSAAYKDGVVYFASNDSHAYAVYTDGTQKWKSAKLPGGGFHSYWPVIYSKDGHDYVVLGGSNDYAMSEGLTIGSLMNGLDKRALYDGIPEGELVGPAGTEPGDWASGTVTIDDRRAAEYLEQQPSRRRVFVLDCDNGQEYTFDSDGDGNPEYAPITWFGTHGGNRFPAVLGGDGVLYQGNSYISNLYIPRGGPSGWKFGTQYISRVHEGTYGAVDEPLGLSAGGNLLYFGWLGGYRGMGAYDITVPHGEPGRLYCWGNTPSWLPDQCPGVGVQVGEGPWTGPETVSYVAEESFGVYSNHGNPNPPIPYNGKIYFHTMNTVFALSAAPPSCQVTSQPTLSAEPADAGTTKDELRRTLAAEVRKMVDAGHLRPGYYHGTMHTRRLGLRPNSYMLDYFHNPAETFIALIGALPHLGPDLQQQAGDYLRSEWALYSDKVHVGWRDGATREAFDVPPEIEANMESIGPKTVIIGSTWDYRYSLYGRWRYIEEFGDQAIAALVFDQIDGTIAIAPPEEDCSTDLCYYGPHIKNAYIAGYVGYVGIGEMAGYPRTGPELSPYVAELNRLLAERAEEFSVDQPALNRWTVALAVARNFTCMTPELADYLSANAYAKVQQALDSYYQVAPYWFVSKYDSTSGEGVLHPLYDYHALFQAKARIMGESHEELVRYIDVPAFERGDLFHIQNLIAAIEAPYLFVKRAKPSFGYQGDTITYTLEFRGGGSPASLTDTLPAGVSQPADMAAEGTDILPQYDPDAHRLEWSGTPAEGQQITIRYSVTIITDEPELLVNTARLQDSGEDPRSVSATVFANPKLTYFPVITKAR